MSLESSSSFWRKIILSESLVIFIGQWLIFNDFYQKWIIWWIMILMVADWIQISCVTVDLKSTKSASRLFFRLESVFKKVKICEKIKFCEFWEIFEKITKKIEKSRSEIENFGRKLKTLTKIEKMLRSKFYTFFRIILMVSFLVARTENHTVF